MSDFSPLFLTTYCNWISIRFLRSLCKILILLNLRLNMDTKTKTYEWTISAERYSPRLREKREKKKRKTKMEKFARQSFILFCNWTESREETRFQINKLGRAGDSIVNLNASTFCTIYLCIMYTCCVCMETSKIQKHGRTFFSDAFYTYEIS